MKNKYYLKQMFIIFASLLLLVQLSGCSDDYLLHNVKPGMGNGNNGNGNNGNGNGNGSGGSGEDNGNGGGDEDGDSDNGDGNGGDDSEAIAGGGNNDNSTPPTHDKLPEALEDADQGIKTHELTKDQLGDIDSALSGLQAKVYVRAYPGRSKENTKPIIVLTQSIFGKSIKEQIADYTDKIQNDSEAKDNFFIFIDKIEALPKTNKFKVKRTLGSDKDITLENYASMKEHSEDILGGHIGDLSNVGGIYYADSQIDVYDAIYKVVEKAAKVLEQGDKWHFNSNKAAIVAFDPIMSTIAIDLAAQNKANNTIKATITKVAATTPVMSFSKGKPYPAGILRSGADDIDSTYANIGYKIKLLDIIGNLSGAIKGKLVYNSLRVYGNEDKNFFATLAGKGNTHNLITKYADSKKINGIKFYFVTGNDHANEGKIDNITGHKLVLDDNVTSDKVGMKAIVQNQSDINNVNIELTEADYNFPANGSDASKYIENNNTDKGLVKYIIEEK